MSFYIKAIGMAGLGGMIFGYDLGVIAGALDPLSKYFNLTTYQQEWVVSLMYVGGGLGAATGGFLCDWWGRKIAILVTDATFFVGAFWLYSARTVTDIYVGRLIMVRGNKKCRCCSSLRTVLFNANSPFRFQRGRELL